MIIETKISKKPVIYKKAIKILENRFTNVLKNKKPELIWILEHNNVYTAGTSFKVSDIIDKSIKIIKGGKERYQSSKNAINFIKNKNYKNVFIHDAARPNFSIKLLKRLLSNLKDNKAVVPFLKTENTWSIM